MAAMTITRGVEHAGLARDAGDQPAAVVVVADRQDPAEEPQHHVVVEVRLLVGVLEGQLDRGVDQEPAENVEHPARCGDRGGSGEDEDGTEHQRQHDADVEHFVLGQCRHREAGHDDHEDEQVVDAQAVFRDVAGDELLTRRIRQEDEQPDREGRRKADVDEHPADGIFGGDGLLSTGDHRQVEDHDREQHHNGDHPNERRDYRKPRSTSGRHEATVRRSLPPSAWPGTDTAGMAAGPSVMTTVPREEYSPPRTSRTIVR